MPARVPATGDLAYGELALNYADGILYYKRSDNTVQSLTAGSGGSAGGGSAAGQTASFGITIDGGGSVITTGVKGYVTVPYNCTITGWTVIADVSGSLVVDVWKDSYTNYPPTSADSIAGSQKPTLVNSVKNQNLSVTAWSTTINAGDVIGFSVESATSVKRVHLSINTTKV